MQPMTITSKRIAPTCLETAARARRGDDSGRDVLIAALARAPSGTLIGALGAIGDDEASVALGYRAMPSSRRA